MHPNDIQDRMKAAYQLLLTETTTREKFESIRTLIKGLSPQVDKTLDETSLALSDFEKFEKGEIIELSAEHLPENTDEEKKRKKALLLLIQSWRQLRSEVDRVQQEFDQMEHGQGKVMIGSKILAGARGPVGIITLAAVVIVGGLLFFNVNKSQPQVKGTSQVQTVSPTESEAQKMRVIEFGGKQIPLSELAERNGPDCDSSHFHAQNHVSVTALDGSTIQDPGACAFGKVKEVKVLEVSNL